MTPGIGAETSDGSHARGVRILIKRCQDPPFYFKNSANFARSGNDGRKTQNAIDHARRSNSPPRPAVLPGRRTGIFRFAVRPVMAELVQLEQEASRFAPPIRQTRAKLGGDVRRATSVQVPHRVPMLSIDTPTAARNSGGDVAIEKSLAETLAMGRDLWPGSWSTKSTAVAGSIS